MNKKDNNVLIIILLILFFPVGLFLMWKSNWNKVVKIIVSCFFGVAVIGAVAGGNESTVNTSESEVAANSETKEGVTTEVSPIATVEPSIVSSPEPTKSPEEIEAEFKATCSTFDYKDIARNPKDYENVPVKLYGKVIQVSEGLFGNVTLRVATAEGEYLGYIDDVYLVTYKQTESNRILEDDMVTIWGMCQGTTTYNSVLGGNITVPSVDLEYYTIE